MTSHDDLNLDVQPSSEMPRIRSEVHSFDRRSERSYEVPSSNSDDAHLLDYVRVLYKRRWLAGTVFLLVFGSVAVYTFTATPIFEANTRLLIESDERNVVSFQQVVDEDQAKADYYQTQYNILQSRALARKTLDTLKLWDNRYFGSPQDNVSLFSSIKKKFGFESAGQGAANMASEVADETQAESRAIDRFLSQLTVSPVRNSRLVDVRYQLPDGQLAAVIVNSLAKNYIAQNLEYKFLASKDASDWLGERLAEQRKQVEAAEVALQQYRERNDAISLEASENIVVQKLGDLNAAVTRAKTVRIEKEALYNQLRASQANPAALDTFPAILTNVFIQQQKSELANLQRQQAQLTEKLGDKHPEMQKIQAAIQLSQSKLDGEIAKVVQSVRSEFQAALAQESSLTTALNQQKGEALSMNRKAIDYGVLERDVESSKQIYDTLMQRAKETGVAAELKTSNVRIVDPAEKPQVPASPRRALNLLLGLCAALFLSVGLGFFFEYLDNRIKAPDEIRAHLGLPSLGMLPAMNSKSVASAYPLITAPLPPMFIEAFRAVRTNIIFGSPDGGSKTLLVTSTGPGEGKTMCASNLAISLAQSGQRVLLIDGDMRKPKVHDAFDVVREPGLSNLLVGAAKASESVRKTHVGGLWLLPAGKTPPNPAELLGSQRFRELLASLKDHFDWIVIDSPPVMAVSDAAVIAHWVTGLVFVIGAEMTSRHAAKTALDQLENARARFIGAILNRVEIEKNGYYYSQYYKKEYARYYQPTGTAN